jgi:hypothetical protein
MNFSELLNKFLDNANLGKIVADTGSGLALALPLLMQVGLSSGMSVLPADHARELKSKTASLRAEHVMHQEAFCNELAIPRRPLTTDPSGIRQQLEAQRCYMDGVRRAAQLNAELAVVTAQYGADLKAGKNADDMVARQTRLQPDADRLTVQQQFVEETAAKLDAAENELRDAQSFSFNMRTLTENLGAMLAIAIILGVIVSQVSRYIFINQLYDRMVKPKHPDSELATSPEFDSLRANYLRYTEASVNMIFPVMAFCVVFPRYASSRLEMSPNAFGWALGGILVSVALFFVGKKTYESYNRKVAEMQGAPRRPNP